MGNSIFGIGMSGMNAAQAGLVTSGHNIANASTPGFNRQEIIQASNFAQATGSGFIGQGVSVTTVKRIYSDALANQLTLAQAQGSQLDAYNTQITQLANMLGDPSAGLAPALQDFFSGVADVAAHAESAASRQAMLATANALSARFQSLDQQLGEIRSGINADITSSVASINNYAHQIARLNQNIVVAESVTAQLPANDLRDQRDALIAALNQEVRATVVKESNGSYDVFIGNGQPVVVGSVTFGIVAAPSGEDSERIEVGYKSGATINLLPASSVQGGRLGGLISFRSTTLDAVQNGLGRVAMGVAQSFNDQHALGQDLNGALGKDFFTPVADPAVRGNSSNTGTATIAATLQNVNALTTSDYRLQYNGVVGANDTFTLTRISDGYAFPTVTFPTVPGSGSVSVDGITLNLTTGGANVNASWLIKPTRYGAGNIGVALSDPAAIAAASPVRTGAALANSGSGTVSAGSVLDTSNWNNAANSKKLAVTFAVSAAGITTYTIVDTATAVPTLLAGPRPYTSGSSISVGMDGPPPVDFGAQVSISGAPANGDVFTIESNTNGIGDNRNALLLGALQTANTLGAASAGGQPTTSFQGAYGQIVSQVGNTARQMQVSAKAQQNLIAQTRLTQQSMSGVNLDEEAANLLRYQQAYQASGKMIQIASSLFQTLLDLGR